MIYAYIWELHCDIYNSKEEYEYKSPQYFSHTEYLFSSYTFLQLYLYKQAGWNCQGTIGANKHSYHSHGISTHLKISTAAKCYVLTNRSIENSALELLNRFWDLLLGSLTHDRIGIWRAFRKSFIGWMHLYNHNLPLWHRSNCDILSQIFVVHHRKFYSRYQIWRSISIFNVWN